MSSYVINKRDYVRLAGVIAGIGTEKNYYREPVFYKYNHEERRLYDEVDFKKEIESLYDLNAISVQMQYHDNEREQDSESYNDEFAKYFNESKKLFRKAVGYGTIDDRQQFKKLLFYIVDFFSSVNYQIEDDECSIEANKIMNYYSNQFVKLIKKIELSSESLTWGDFEFFE